MKKGIKDPNCLVPTGAANGGYKERARLSGVKEMIKNYLKFQNLIRNAIFVFSIRNKYSITNYSYYK